MVTTYKNPTRVARKASEVSTAWEQIAPDAEFAGMTLTAFKTAIGESFTLRERAAQLEAELSANLARRAIAEARCLDLAELRSCNARHESRCAHQQRRRAAGGRHSHVGSVQRDEPGSAIGRFAGFIRRLVESGQHGQKTTVGSPRDSGGHFDDGPSQVV